MLKVACHHDADGIYGTALFQSVTKTKVKPFFPEIFGDYMDEDVMIDMRPKNSHFKGKVFDHHPGHPEKHDYDLIFGDGSASLVVFNALKKKIPESEWWKVVGGCVGDVSAHFVPREIWKRYPTLLRDIHFPSQYKGFQTWSLPMYKMLSSPVNAMCRVHKEQEAFTLVRNAKKPIDVVFDPEATRCRNLVKRETASVIKSTKPFEVNTGIIIWPFRSIYRLTGILCSKLHDASNKTVAAFNEKSGSGSVRGDLATPIIETFQEAGLKAGGHLSAGGFKADTLKEVIRILGEVI